MVMLRQLPLGYRIARNSSRFCSRCSELPPCTRPPLAAAVESDDDTASDDDEFDDFDRGEVGSRRPRRVRRLRDVAAIRRGRSAGGASAARWLAIARGSVCAVQRLHGVCLLRVVEIAGEGCRMGRTTELTVRDETPPQPRSLADATEHGAAVVNALCAHGAALLANRSADAQTSQLAAAALRGGHALLCGTAGNGKRRALRRVAARLRASANASVVRLRCARLLAAVESGGLDAALDSVFDEARRRSPSLLLLSELQLLAAAEAASAAASAVGGDAAADGTNALQSQAAAALLARMRSAPQGVLVVASIVEPLALPSCLRSHGGFELTFLLPPPSADERAALLAKWLPPAREAGEGDLLTAEAHASALAKLTASFSLRDTKRLLTATSLPAAARGAADAPTWSDVLTTLQQTRPLDEQHGLLAPLANASGEEAWSRVGGYEALRTRLQRLLDLLAKASANGGGQSGGGTTLGMLQPPSGALLYGPSGNGKSLLASSLASACGWPTLNVSASQLFGAYVGDTEAAIRNVFRIARERAPSIIILDELDSIGGRRGGEEEGYAAAGGSSVAERALSTLLNEMDGIGVTGPQTTASGSGGNSRPAVLLIGCTNRPELVDAALLRPGRLEQMLYVREPNESERADVLRVHASGLPLVADADLKELAAATEGFSCAALAALCKEAARHALARHLSGGEAPKEASPFAIVDDDDDDDAAEGQRVMDEAEWQRSDRDLAARVSIAQSDLLAAMRSVRQTQVPAVAAREKQAAAYEAFHSGGAMSAN